MREIIVVVLYPAASLSLSLSFSLSHTQVSIGFTRRKGAVRHVHPSAARLLDEFPAYMQVKTIRGNRGSDRLR